MVENVAANQDDRYRIKNKAEEEVTSQVWDVWDLRRLGNEQ